VDAHSLSLEVAHAPPQDKLYLRHECYTIATQIHLNSIATQIHLNSINGP